MISLGQDQEPWSSEDQNFQNFKQETEENNIDRILSAVENLNKRSDSHLKTIMDDERYHYYPTFTMLRLSVFVYMCTLD